MLAFSAKVVERLGRVGLGVELGDGVKGEWTPSEEWGANGLARGRWYSTFWGRWGGGLRLEKGFEGGGAGWVKGFWGGWVVGGDLGLNMLFSRFADGCAPGRGVSSALAVPSCCKARDVDFEILMPRMALTLPAFFRQALDLQLNM